MESSASRLAREQRQQAEIRKQIALLQSQLVERPGQSVSTPLTRTSASPKRKQPESRPLVPATPSPKKRKLDHNSNADRLSPKSFHRSKGSLGGLQDPYPRSNVNKHSQLVRPPPQPLKLAPSNVLSKLAGHSNRSQDTTDFEDIQRSSGFSEKPAPVFNSEPDVTNAPKRDDRLVLIEDLEVGPVDHNAPFDDPNFQQLEPNSGIRLSSRIVPHDDVQEYLTGRFYLSPSRLYSVIRLLPNKQGFDVPVSGDWVTIAVVAERGEVKYSRAPVGIGREDDDATMDAEGSNELISDGSGRFKFDDSIKPAKPKPKHPPPPKASGKKYVNIKLIDFGSRSKSSSSATGGKATIRGDAFLSLLLFESDGYDKMTKESSGKVEKVYKGGSRGAFEAMSKLKEGDVIAMLNPKVLKPFQRSADGGKPHPTNNILAVTPESASSIMVLGRARDLGMCQSLKRDGKVCGGWCDKRVSDVCEWHIQHAVEKRRSGRSEFAIGTSGMSASSGPVRKPAYDPARQWGLKPEPSVAEGTGASATYVVSGHVVSNASRSLFVTENIGREGQAKAKRKYKHDADRELKALLERGDKEGMKAVIKARELAKSLEDKKNGKPGKDKGKGKEKMGEKAHSRSKGKSKAQSEDNDLVSGSGSDVAGEKSTSANAQKNAYSAQVIKQLGFDPTMKPGQKRADDSIMQKKLEALTAVQSSRKEIELGPRPGQRIRSGVVVPTSRMEASSATESISHSLGDSADEGDSISFGIPKLLEGEKLVDLDSSDVE